MHADKTILVVEDEADLCDLIGMNLQREGYKTRLYRDGALAHADIQRQRPDLVILDRMLPGKSGDEILASMRHDLQTAAIPVIMLTARADETDELVGFALGADDYVTKPFSMKALMARVSAVIKRGRTDEQSNHLIQTCGPISLDASRYEARVDGHAIELTTTEFRILHALLSSHGRLLSRNQLIDVAIGPDVAVVDRTIDVHIAALRKKLGSAAGWIKTVRGVGYTCREINDDCD